MNLYNKYRPSTFNELIGQGHNTKIIEHQIEHKNLPQSLIFHGPSGVGKTSLARLVAKKLNEHPSGLVEKDSTIEVRMDDIRALQTDVNCKPFEGFYKTYIFDEAHRIGKKGFDSLLKCIEEPPEFVVFIFVTTEYNQIPATIKNRSQSHCFNPVSEEKIKERLSFIAREEKINCPDLVLDFITSNVQGSVRAAVSMLEKAVPGLNAGLSENELFNSLGFSSNCKILEVLKSYLATSDIEELVLAVDELGKGDTDIIKVVSNLQEDILTIRYAYALNDFTKVPLYLNPLLNQIDKLSPEEKINKMRSLDVFYDKTVLFLKDIPYIQNYSARLKRMTIDLLLER